MERVIFGDQIYTDTYVDLAAFHMLLACGRVRYSRAGRSNAEGESQGHAAVI